MPRIIVAAFALALLSVLPACTDDGATPDGAEPSPYSGSFYVDFTIDDNDCAFPPPLDGPFRIKVAGEEITFGDVVGVWDESEARGTGTSPVHTVPIDPSTGCIGSFTMSFDMTFVSPDSFSGIYLIENAFSPECDTDSCHTRFAITGARLQ